VTLHELLVPGNVLTLFCDFTNPQKPKLLVLVCLNPQVTFFIINSELNDFRANRPEVREHQVELKKDQHPFLRKPNSWIDCFKVVRQFDAQEIARQEHQRIGKFEGVIHNDIRAAIRSVVKDSRSLENRFKNGILQDLKDFAP
jgi:hypothetical protein